MEFKNWMPWKKGSVQDVENRVESSESIEDQIEQEVQQLDPKLESIRNEIEDLGGIDGLNGLISRHQKELQKWNFVKGYSNTAPFLESEMEPFPNMVKSGIGIAFAFVLVMMKSAINHNSFDDFLTSLFNSHILLYGAAAPHAISVLKRIAGSLLKHDWKKWWETRKLRSLKSKAEAAGIA